MEIYDILDEFNHEFSTSDLDQKWYLYGAPSKIIETIESQSQLLEKQKENFIKQMEEDQEEFEETLNGLQMTVAEFCNYTDINKFEENAVVVESVNQSLE